MKTYFKSDIAAIIKEPLAKVQAWTDSEIINASISGSKGKGRARIYSHEDLIQFCMLKIWKDECSYSLGDIKIYLDFLRRGIPENGVSLDDIPGGKEFLEAKKNTLALAIDAVNLIDTDFLREKFLHAAGIIYKDFFLNTVWGLEKEVVIATVKGKAVHGVRHAGLFYHIINDRNQIENLPFLNFFIQNYIGFTLVMCGSTKIKAMDVFKINQE